MTHDKISVPMQVLALRLTETRAVDLLAARGERRGPML